MSAPEPLGGQDEGKKVMTEGIISEEPAGKQTPFERLSLWEALALLWRNPGPTFRRLFNIARGLPAAEGEPGAPAVVEAPPSPAAATPPPPAEEAPRVDQAERAEAQPRAIARPMPLVRLVALAHGAQCAFALWLLIVLASTPNPPATFQVQTLVLWTWVFGNSAVVYGVSRGQSWARRALPYSEGFLTLLSLLATIQWAQTAGAPGFQVELVILTFWFMSTAVLVYRFWRGRVRGSRVARGIESAFTLVAALAMIVWAAFVGVEVGDCAGWAGALAILNLALGAALIAHAGRAPSEPDARGNLLWITNHRAYLVFLGAWAALLLAVAGDSVLAGASILARRGADTLYYGSPVVCAGMILWLFVAWVAAAPAGRRRLAGLMGIHRGLKPPVQELAKKEKLSAAEIVPVEAAPREPVAVQPAAPTGAALEVAEAKIEPTEAGEVVEAEVSELPPAREIAVVEAGALVGRPASMPSARSAVGRLETLASTFVRRQPSHHMIAVAVTALVMATLVLLAVAPVRDLGILGWVALVVLYVSGSLVALLLGVGWRRVMTGQAALLLSFFAFEGAAGNLFTAPGVAAWAFSVALWWLALRDAAAEGAILSGWLGWLRRAGGWLQEPTVAFRVDWTLAALVAVTLIGAFFRFSDLEGVPPEMTSDHVEKLLDAARVSGDLGPEFIPQPQVFFPNNGGREPIQMYLVALAQRLTSLPYNFTLLKLVSGLEAVITIPLMYGMGKELVSRRVGLIVAALVAVSYWHTVLGRMGLRIVLTPLLMALALVYLARAMRRNRRADFLKVGLLLGVGVYAYQAMRMAPLFVTIGVGLAFLLLARDWRERRRYAVNSVALVLIALAVFVPMARFMFESPEHFWMRTIGRLGGEPDVAAGNVDPVGQLINNYNIAIWMYAWKGDVQWISNVPNQPHMDPLSVSLLALGVAAWLARLVRRHDPVDLTLVFVAAIMLLPSALALAFPNENPSATRASGTLPVVYLWAAYALDQIIDAARQAFRARVAALSAGVVAIALVFGAASYNYILFFDAYRESYALSAKPYRAIGAVVRGFADSIGSMETAFIVAYPHWLDHRAVGIEAGDINWVNRDRLIDVKDINLYAPIQRTTAMMVLYHLADAAAAEYLHAVYPEGRSSRYHMPDGDQSKDFYMFIVPGPVERAQSVIPPPEQAQDQQLPGAPPVQPTPAPPPTQ